MRLTGQHLCALQAHCEQHLHVLDAAFEQHLHGME